MAVKENDNGAYVGELVYTTDPTKPVTAVNGQYAAAAGDDVFRFDGSSVFLKDNYHYTSNFDDQNPGTPGKPAVVHFSKNGKEYINDNAQLQWGAKVLDTASIWQGLKLEIDATVDGTTGEVMIEFPEMPTTSPAVTVTPVSFKGYETGAVVANINSVNLDSNSYGMNYTAFPFEINGDKIKLKDEWYIDPYTKDFMNKASQTYMTFNDTDAFNLISYESVANDVNFYVEGFKINDLYTNVTIQPIPNFAGPPVGSKDIPTAAEDANITALLIADSKWQSCSL